MENNNSRKDQDPFVKLQIAQQIREYHHKSLWEEEKHFTWFLSIILSSALFILDKSLFTSSSLIIGLGGIFIFGAFISMIGYLVIRRESEYFVNANKLFVDEYNHCFPSKQIPTPKGSVNKSIKELVKSLFTFKVGVRDCFQILFLIFMITFISLAFFYYYDISTSEDKTGNTVSTKITQQQNPPDCQTATRPASR